MLLQICLTVLDVDTRILCLGTIFRILCLGTTIKNIVFRNYHREYYV